MKRFKTCMGAVVQQVPEVSGLLLPPLRLYTCGSERLQRRRSDEFHEPRQVLLVFSRLVQRRQRVNPSVTAR